MNTTVEENVEIMRIQVAERLGWQSIEYNKDGYLIGYPRGRRLFAVIPSYVRDIKAAWSLVEYLALYGIRTHLDAAYQKANRVIVAELEYQGKRLARAETTSAPLAICQAFLSIPGDQLASSFLGSRP